MKDLIIEFLKILFIRGLREYHNNRERKIVYLINFYCFILFLYTLFFGTINLFDKEYILSIFNLSTAFLLLINYILFGKIKNISIASNFTLLLFSEILLFTFISGGKNGTGLFWPIVYPIVALQLCGTKRGTIYFIISIIIQIFFSFYKVSPLVYNYNLLYPNYPVILFRIISIQLFLYLTSYYYYKNRNKLLNEIEEVNKQKTTFFINLAHETKTPLTLIGNYLDNYIKEEGLSPKLKVIKNNLDKLRRDMINFLDAEKLEKGQIFYNHNQILNLSEVLKIKVLLFKEIAIKRNIKIKTDIGENIYLKIDSFALDRVINNLIDNAIKYNKQGGIIEISLKTNNDKIMLIIKDNGIGIVEEQQKHVFEPYYQITHEKRNIQGIGMGLYIVKKIIEEVNGKIKIESKLNKGTTFKITFHKYNLTEQDRVNEDIKYSLPIDNIENIQIKETEFKVEKNNIFIVEDNLDMLLFLQSSFEEKYNIYYATNGKEALEIIKKVPIPNVIISDIMMDVMDGYTFYEILSKNKVYSSIPFIFLTAKTDFDEKLYGLKKGAIDYVTKPFLIDELIYKVDSIIKHDEKQKEVILEKIGNELYKKLNDTSDIDNEKKETVNEIDDKYEGMNYNIIGKLLKEYDISRKELEVLNLLKDKLMYKEISYALNISINSVKTHIKNIYKKCKVKNINELLEIINK